MRMNSAEDFGNLVRERRQQLQLSQQEVADRAGVDRSWLSTVERGHPRAELGKVLRLVRALDMSLDLTAMTARVRGGFLTEHLKNFEQAPGHPRSAP